MCLEYLKMEKGENPPWRLWHKREIPCFFFCVYIFRCWCSSVLSNQDFRSNSLTSLSLSLPNHCNHQYELAMPLNSVVPKPENCSTGPMNGLPNTSEPHDTAYLAYPAQPNPQSVLQLILYPITLKVSLSLFLSLSTRGEQEKVNSFISHILGKHILGLWAHTLDHLHTQQERS